MPPNPTTEAVEAPAAQPVWDLPTRLFHWAIVVLFGLSWWSAEEHYERIHLWSGYSLLFALLFRLGWGLVGSSTARFAGFIRGPSSVLRYIRSNWSWPVAGHSPLGALSVVALLALLVVQVGLGLFSTDEDGLMYGPLAHLISLNASEEAVDLHEDNFELLKIFVGLHVLALVFYRFVLGKRLVKPMISGRSELDPDVQPMRPAPRWRAVACAAVALGVTTWIVAGAPPLGT